MKKIIIIAIMFVMTACDTYKDEFPPAENNVPDNNTADNFPAQDDAVTPDDGVTDNGNQPDNDVADIPFKEASSGGVTFKWRVNGDSVDMKLIAQTTGWISVGFDPSSTMLDADFKIGYVAGGTAHIEDHYGNGETSHRKDDSGGGTSNITNIAGSESGGKTELTFTVPVNSGDSHDKIFSSGSSHFIILAYGEGDDVQSMHSGVGTTSIKM